MSEKRQAHKSPEIIRPESLEVVAIPSTGNSSANATSPRLPPFQVLDSQTSNMKSCNNFVTIPNYNLVPITGYFDLDLPAALSPQVSSYGTIPVLLQNSKGDPGLIVRAGVSVYGREHMCVPSCPCFRLCT